MICGVKPASFKYDTHRQIDFPQRLFVALRATNEGRIVEMLTSIELNAAMLAAIGVYWHATLLFLSCIKDYSPLELGMQDKTRKKDVSVSLAASSGVNFKVDDHTAAG